MKSFLQIEGMGQDEILGLLSAARGFRDNPGAHRQELRGRAVAMLFFEPSTRTRLSFELAAHRLGADVLIFDPDTGSTLKGETLRDTVMTVAAMGVDTLVVRHREPGTAESIAEWTGQSVVNAGDGTHEHPSQALLDAFTIQSHFGEMKGLRVGVVGDVGHSRVAGSLISALPTLGMDLTLIGPESLLPAEDRGVAVSTDLDGLLETLDVVYLLRVQKERGALVADDYSARFGMTFERASRMKPESVIMHPGPMNRGVEVTSDVADGPRSLILRQVTNSVPARMAILSALEGPTA
jgi:aspartate carbamoyltransferase catalytic subunit